MSEKTVNIKIEGMHCGSCINHITTKLARLEVLDVDIDIARKFTRIKFDQDVDYADTIIETINNAGYETKKLSVIDNNYNKLD